MGLDNHCNHARGNIKEGIEGGEDGRMHTHNFERASYVVQIVPPMLPRS
jgi:hypothetical protein